MDEYEIDWQCLAQIYVSPHSYNNAFVEEISLRRFDAFKSLSVASSFVLTMAASYLPTSNGAPQQHVFTVGELDYVGHG